MGEVLDVSESAVEDEGFTTSVNLDKVSSSLLSDFLDVLHGSELSFVHAVVFGELEHDRLLIAVKVRLNIVSGVDLAEGTFTELLRDNEAVVEEESLQFLNDRDLAMLLAAFHQYVLYSIFWFHLVFCVSVSLW